MERDPIDEILDQWSEERPDLDTASLGVVIRVMTLYRSFRRQADRALEPLDLELWEYDVLSALRRQGSPFQLPATALARTVSLSSGAMTNRIDKLETKAFVERNPDPGDRRGVNVKLTRKGRSAIDKAIRGRLNAANDCISSLTGPERKTLASLLRKVALSSVD